MAWAWVSLKRSILSDEAVLEVSAMARYVFLGLHLVADEHGRFRAGVRSLKVQLGLIDGEDLGALMDELQAAKLIHLYSAEGVGYGLIDGYDARLTGAQRRKRPAPEHPAPCPEIMEAAKADPSAQRTPGHRPDTVRTEKDTVRTEEDIARTPSGLDKTRQEKTRGEDLSAPEGAHTHEGPPQKTSGRRSSRTFDEFAGAARESAEAWCDEMATRRRRNGGAVSATETAADALQAHGAELLRMSEQDQEAFTGAVDTMIEKGRGFGRGGPRDGIPYLRTIFSGWHAEQEGTTRAKRRKKEGPDFVRVGPPPTPGPVAWTLVEDNELADVL